MRSWARWPDAVALARIVTIVSPSGKRTLRLADAQDDITIGSFTWTAEPGCLSTAIAYANDGTVSNMEVTVSAYETGQLKPKDVIFGIFDGSSMIVELIDPTSPDSGTMVLLSGYVGIPKLNRDGTATFELRSVLMRARSVVSEQFGPMCRADYGDDRCKKAVLPADITRNKTYVVATSIGGTLDYDRVNDAWGRVRTGSAGDPSDYANVIYECTTAGTTAGSAPTYDPTIGNTTTDGTAIFIARDSLCRYAKIDSIVDGHSILIDRLPEAAASVDGYYTLGTIILRSGDNEDVSFPLSNWDPSGNKASFFLDISQIVVGGEWIEIMRGCDKTESTCFTRDNNIINRRAESFVPGRDLLLTQIPNSA